MTRILIISDIHGNHRALDVVIEAAEERGEIDAVRCIGDVVGYYLNPQRAWAKVLKHDPEMRVGNHEAAVAEDACGDDMSLSIGAVMAACRHRAFLRKEPSLWQTLLDAVQNPARHKVRQESVDGYHLQYVHGTPIGRNPDDPRDYIWLAVKADYNYPRRTPAWEIIGDYLTNTNGNHEKSVLFFGHTHLPTFAHYIGYGPTFEGASYNRPVEIDAYARVVVNPGSIGAPRDGVIYRDGQKQAHGVILDTTQHTVEFLAVSYDPGHIPQSWNEDYCVPFDDNDIRNVCRALVRRNMVDGECRDVIWAGCEFPNDATRTCLNRLWNRIKHDLLALYFNAPCPSNLVYEYSEVGFDPHRQGM